MKKVLKLQDLDCAHCASKIEDSIKKIDGVSNATVNFLNQKIILETVDDNIEAIIKEIKALVKKIEPDVVVLD